MSEKTKPVLLIIRDGWGENHNHDQDGYNAIMQAATPCADRLTKVWPRTEIMACGLDVGLPEGIMGNSEVGHQNIGAGRIVDQEIVRIDKGFLTGSVTESPALQGAFKKALAGGRLHLMGLTSAAGVHAMLDHLYALIDLADKAGLKEIYIHAFTDGRDSPPTSGLGYLAEVEAKCRETGIARIASVAGRFWSMDRDKRWDRVQKAYDALTGRKIERTAKSAAEAVQFYYDNPLDDSRHGDEFIVPTVIVDDAGKPAGIIRDGDAVIFFNFRGDRPRELTHAFIDVTFEGFDRGPKLDLFYATMTDYQTGLCPNVLFPKPPKMVNTLGQYIADRGIAQFRCAETEKYPHVTFFFNDYRNDPFPGEDQKIVPSPQDVATYDQKPEMSAEGVCEATREAILSGKYGLIVVNFANADMVGHTGNLEAAKAAAAYVDSRVAILLEAVDQTQGCAIVTADHGNSDQMWDPESNSPHTRHTLNPVEIVLYGTGCQGLKLRSTGRLADIAPTVLDLMGLAQPAEMTGESLIVR